MRLKIDWASLTVGRKFAFALFYFVFEGNFQAQAPGGDLCLEGRFNGGFFALRVWGAYIWRGLYIERLIFEILRYCSKVHLVVTLHSSSVNWLESQLYLLDETSSIFVVETNEIRRLQTDVSEFTQRDGRKKRTAKRLCVTNVTGLLLESVVVVFPYH